MVNLSKFKTVKHYCRHFFFTLILTFYIYFLYSMAGGYGLNMVPSACCSAAPAHCCALRARARLNTHRRLLLLRTAACYPSPNYCLPAALLRTARTAPVAATSFFLRTAAACCLLPYAAFAAALPLMPMVRLVHWLVHGSVGLLLWINDNTSSNINVSISRAAQNKTKTTHIM